MAFQESDRVLKAGSFRNMGSKVAFNYHDLEKQGESYLADIKKQADKILDDAKQQADAIISKSQAEGLEKGLTEGRQNAQQEIEQKANQLSELTVQNRVSTVLPALDKVAQTLLQEKDNWLYTWEKIAIELAARIASKVVHRAIELDPELTTEMLRSTLELVAGSPEVTVYLSQDDYETLGDERDNIVKSLSSCGKVNVLMDENLGRGDSRVETQHGSVDAGLETQIERIANELISDN
ncbi:flagellar assembly protein H [Polystyrenella longa]|uniref:Flagellar assembly protein FliH n=1 Tax=Polystyrenella longa TaxID=2528007 RepID=A0A518CIQ2_9PLAN|nr:FliH/SctL family protein [Polystyrenella longa]QDU79115.1 flagellar assembly protein H [Polystyrenella longa]